MLLKSLLDKVVRPGVSDLHLKVNEPPMVRHMGSLVSIGAGALKTEDLDTILNSITDEEQRAKLASTGGIDFSYPCEGIGRLRINAYRQRGTLALAIRIVPAMAKTFDELHLPKDTMERLCQTNRGLILITGVTGAGKTTTLNAILHHMNANFSYNIITIENPVEFSHSRIKSSISQREVGRDVPTFSGALSVILRQDPDVIVFGEINDRETYQAAIDGAASGHLVLATVHGSDTLDAVDRIVNAFDPHNQVYIRTQLTNGLKAIVAQRLFLDKTGKTVWPATEVLFGTLQLKKLLASNSTSEAKFLMEKGGAFGMHTFDQDLLRMVEESVIAGQDAINHATNPNDLRIKIQSQAGPGSV